ncbi:hypothetical protein X777_10389, partial [Ooceraea biroi]
SRSGGLPAIVPLHLALVAIELVVGAANKLTLPAADLVTECGGATMLCRNLNYPLAASLTLQMAERPKMHTSAYIKYPQTFNLQSKGHALLPDVRSRDTQNDIGTSNTCLLKNTV